MNRTKNERLSREGSLGRKNALSLIVERAL
jgi:hypothetical protein